MDIDALERFLDAHFPQIRAVVERALVRDRASARSSLERILGWDFDRVVVAHGTVLETGGRQALRAGYRWLLDA